VAALLAYSVVLRLVQMSTQFSWSTAPWRSSRATSHHLSAFTRQEPPPLANHLDEIMASATSPAVKHLLQTINADGFFSMKDAAKGSEAKEFARKEYPITTVDGLEFCKVHTFGDPVSRRYPFSPHPSNTVNSELVGSSSLPLTGLA